jgi:hypothetical protein
MPAMRFIPAIALLFAVSLAPQTPPAFDVLITGGRVVDGTGAPWFRADIGIRADRIAAIGNLSGATARTRIDATNLVVSPGFIDMLSQSRSTCSSTTAGPAAAPGGYHRLTGGSRLRPSTTG